MKKKVKKAKKQYEAISVQLPLSVVNKIKRIAKITDLSFNKVCEVLVMAYVLRSKSIEKTENSST